MGEVMPFIALVQSWLSRVDLSYLPHSMTLVLKWDNKERKGLESLFIYFENLVDLLKTPVAVCVRRLYGFCAL